MTHSVSQSSSNNTTTQRLRWWTWRFVAVVLMAMGVMWLVQMLLLPWVVGRQFSAALERLGFAHATFSVRQASLTGAEVADIRAGDVEPISINRITVTYSPWKVIRGKLNSIVIAGAEILVPIGGGKTMSISGTPHAGAGSEMPFDRIEIRSSTLKLDWEDRHFWLPVDGTLDVAANGKMKLAARTFFRGVEAPITGTLADGFKSLDLRCQADEIGAAGLISALPQRWTKGFPAISGTLKLDAAVHKSGDELGLDLNANGPGAQVHAGSALLRGPSLQLHLLKTSDERGTTMNFTQNSTVGLNAVEVGNSHSEPLVFSLTGFVFFGQASSESSTVIALKLQAAKPVSFNSGPLTVSAGAIGITGTVTAPKATAHGAITIANASIIDTDAKIEAKGISGSIPFAWNTQLTEPGKISMGNLTLDGTPLPPPSATIKFVNGALDANMIWEPLEGAQLTTSANFSRAPAKGWVGQITISAPHFVISDPGAWRKLVKSRGDVDITGTFTLDAKAEFENGRMRPRVRLQAQNAAVSSKEYDFAIEGLSADLTLWRLWPVATIGSQVIKASTARIGKMNLSDGLLQIRISDPHSILIEKTSWAWAGGHVHSYAIQFDPAKPNADLTLYADDLSVGELLHFSFPERDVNGQGRLYGRLPANIHWPGIDFGDGYLYSTPGSGQLSLGSEAKTVAEMVAGSSTESSNQVKDQLRSQLMQAMRHFRYDLVKVDFVKKDGSMTASIHVKGQGEDHGMPLDITFNINGVDEVFRSGLVIKLAKSLGK